MKDKLKIGGVTATTHIDAHGERLPKEALDQMAKGINENKQLMYWNHETTLPPIGLITKAWVEEREDGEYQLTYDGFLFQDEDIEFLPNSDIQGRRITSQDFNEIFAGIEPSGSGHLEISYDPRNFDDIDVTPIIDNINKLVETSARHYIRKAELPQAVIWIIVGFTGGHIASGFFSRIGEVAADKFLEVSKEFYEQLSTELSKLLEKAKPKNKLPDILFHIPLIETDTIVEGALENANENDITKVLEKLPELYAIAMHLIRRNPPNFFSQMQFLYNSETESWDVNYFVTRKTNRIIQGPRYYDPSHPLRAKYEEALKQLSQEEG